jgi:CRISPR-associated protein Csm1
MVNNYKEKLKNAFNKKEEQKPLEGFLLKGDVSGIQEFIFNIPSDGAARLLKARSFFLQVLTKLCIHKLLKERKENSLIDSGGAFYIRLDNELDLKSLKAEINKPLLEYGLFISFSQAPLKDGWAKAMEEIRKQEEKEKYQKFNGRPEVFEPTEVLIKDATEEKVAIKKWKELAKNLSKAIGYYIEKTNDNHDRIKISENSVSIWDRKLTLVREEGNCDYLFNTENPRSFIMKEMPVWRKENPYLQASLNPDSDAYKWEKELKTQKGNENRKENSYQEPEVDELIDLDHFGLQAKMRTGTNKLGILKLDVDNLGSLFRDTFCTYPQFSDASDALSYFFGPHLMQLWEKEFRDDVLVVFSGGDDCFALGAWDCVFEFAGRLQDEFKSFTEERLTFSASLMVLDTGYPVIRIGKEAESLLDKAKSSSDKNAINVFGEVFPWKNFKCADAIKNTLQDFILNRDESKSILQTIRLSARGYETIEKGIKNRNSLNMQKVWNLSWFLLRKVKDDNKEDFDKKIVSEYHDSVLDALVNKNFTKALTFPMAARWTELLIRNK